MQQAGNNSLHPMYAVPSAMTNQDVPQKEEDTQEVASFLLALKHRSVTPEPPAAVLESEAPRSAVKTPYQSYGYVSYGYDPSYPEGQEVRPTVPTPSYGYPSFYPSAPLEQHQQQASFAADPPRAPPATHAEAPPTLTSIEDLDFDAIVAESNLVYPKDRDLVPDALYLAMAQMKLCKLTQADRVGCYKSREIGFVGMCCKHCSGQPGFGRYYPNSVRSLAQTTTSQTILKHIGSKCRFCPADIREAVQELLRQQAAREGMASGRPRYGSRKIFFQRVWARLHGGTFSEEADDASNQTPSEGDEERSILSSSTPDIALEDTEAMSSSSLKRTNRFGVLPTQKNKRIKVGDGVPKHLFTSE